MNDRDHDAGKFLAKAGWPNAATSVIAGDASNRRYLRLRCGNDTAVLMDAPREKGEDVGPFMRIARYLADLGLSAPRILASDEVHGFLLLEDLGDDLFGRVIHADPGKEERLYYAATDLLIHLHRHDPPSGLGVYTAELMADLSALAFDWYLRTAKGPNMAARENFISRFRPLLDRHASRTDVVILRDYHAENLLWLPDRKGNARVGLLDFQDAMCGHGAYDLVSLLQDARRDVPVSVESAMLAHFQDSGTVHPEAFEAAYHCLGVQRNLRIIGVFARLCLRDGKPHYVDLIPRVWSLLQRDLAHPSMISIAPTVHDVLPEPTTEILNRLKSGCATVPTA